jgi:RNA polymerase sigma-70 factor (ECF subfamily)
MSTMHGGDADDWAAAQRGDGDAYGRIFDRHRDRVARHAHRLVPRFADVDDVVAVTFLEAWRRRGSARMVDDSILPWLLVTATNVARNVSRSTHRYRRLLATLPSADPAPDPALVIDDGPAVTALRHLAINDRQVITLCVLEGFSEAEAASVLGVARGTVKSRLSRAKQRLAVVIADPVPPATHREGVRP